jgi:hypothetical protein
VPVTVCPTATPIFLVPKSNPSSVANAPSPTAP